MTISTDLALNIFRISKDRDIFLDNSKVNGFNSIFKRYESRYVFINMGSTRF